MIIVLAKKEKTSEKLPLENQIVTLSKIKKIFKDSKAAKKILKQSDYDLDILEGINIDFSDEISVPIKVEKLRFLVNIELLSEPIEVIAEKIITEMPKAIRSLNRVAKMELKALSKIKNAMKEDEVVEEIFEDAGHHLDTLDGINIDFSDEIDVSAKTINSRILLNKKLLDESFDIMMRYAVHELVHALQHMESEDAIESYMAYDKEEYLDRPDEIEAFQRQNQYDANQRGEEEVVAYVEDLVDYHDIPPDEQEDKKEELLEKV